MTAGPLLSLTNVNSHYGPVQVLFDVNLEVHEGEIVCLLGGNASGKSTTMKTIIGTLKPLRGEIQFDGKRIDRLSTDKVVRMGIAQSPEGRRIFARMSVLENLQLGAFARADRHNVAADMQRVLALFPRLNERLYQKGGTLSGGEQQMLAIGRALMASPKLLLLDEPSMGLSPILVETIFATISDIRRQGTTILLVEQNARMALRVANRGYVIQAGYIVLHDAADELLRSDLVRKSYLGERIV